jgi:uncharacterized protein
MRATGLSLKPQHYQSVLALNECDQAGLWFEVHPENYFVNGGPRLSALVAVADKFPISLHSVSLNLGGIDPLDLEQLAALRQLSEHCAAVRLSEHLAWSRHGGRYFPDLLPVMRTQENLLRIARRIQACQEALGCRLAIENPSHYLDFAEHEYTEADFLQELVQRSGCSLLLDVNNVFISAHNLGYSAAAYLEGFPLQHVTEIHLAGHKADEVGNSSQHSTLLIDSHDCAVSAEVIALYQAIAPRLPQAPCLIERDGNVPELDVLLAERRSISESLA